MVLDYVQTMWAQKPVCGLFANNVGSLAAIVGPTSRVFADNVGRQVPLFAGQPADDCGPLHVPFSSEDDKNIPRLAVFMHFRLRSISSVQYIALVRERERLHS
jgi:hypothetical protein